MVPPMRFCVYVTVYLKFVRKLVMNRSFGLATAFGASLLLVHFAMASIASFDDTRELSLEESSAIWGAGSNCVATELGETQGCSDAECTAIDNVKAEGTGDSQITNQTCTYQDDIWEEERGCGSFTVSSGCD
jgi:hypothetical protein